MEGLVGINSHALTQKHLLISYESERSPQRSPVELLEFASRIIRLVARYSGRLIFPALVRWNKFSRSALRNPLVSPDKCRNTTV